VFFKRGAGSVISSLTNISIVEVQGDRPRLSYDITNGVVEDTPHLLLEPSSTNLIDNSSLQGVGTGVAPNSWTAFNPEFSSDGQDELNGFKIKFAATNSREFIMKTITVSSQTYALSFYTHEVTTSLNIGDVVAIYGVTLAIDGRFEDGASVGNIAIKSNRRYSIVFTVSSGTSAAVRLGGGVNGNATFDFVLSKPQLEQQSYATSYIPTAGTTITRAAETCNNSKPSVNSTEGVFYAEIQALASDSTAKEITINGGNTSNRIVISFNTLNQLRADYTASSSLQARFNRSINIEQFNKIAFAYAVNDFKLYINGVLSGTDTSGSVISAGTLTTLDFDNGAGNFDFYGKVKGLAVYNEALTDAQLIELTS